MNTMTIYSPQELLDYASDTLSLFEPGTGLKDALKLAAVPADAHEAVLVIAHDALDHAKGGQR
jgi:hypothetical protein